MKITQHTSPNRTIGRSGWTPDIIVCHITDGAFDGAVSWLTNPASQVSSHFVVAQDGRVAQLVPIQDTAWANGTVNDASDNRGNQHSKLAIVRERGVNANLYTISIEHEGRFSETQGELTPKQLDASKELIAHIRAEVKRIYNTEIPLDREHIVGHSDITPRWKPNCPGERFPFDKILTPSPPAVATPSPWAKEAWEWAVKNKLTDGTNPQGTPTREQMIQLLYNYERFSSLPSNLNQLTTDIPVRPAGGKHT